MKIGMKYGTSSITLRKTVILGVYLQDTEKYHNLTVAFFQLGIVFV